MGAAACSAFVRSFLAVELYLVLAAVGGCASCRPGIYLPTQGGDWRLAGAVLVYDRLPEGLTYWSEEFSMDPGVDGVHECRVNGYTLLTNGTTDTYSASWKMRLSERGSEHLDGENPTRELVFMQLPGRLCEGERLKWREGYEVRVGGFETVCTFDGPIPDCVRVDITTARGGSIAEWHAPGRGPVRIEARANGVLTAAGAAYRQTMPTKQAVLELFDWPDWIIARELPQAMTAPGLR